MTDVVLGYLTFLTNENNVRRADRFWKAVETIKPLVENAYVINVDNGSHVEAQKNLNAIFDNRVRMNENFYDASLFFVTLWEAQRLNARYVGFLYDDFIFYRHDFTDACVSYLDKNEDVMGVRLPCYEFDNRQLYDTRYTDKNKNPDAVFHGHGLNKAPLVWSSTVDVDGYRFASCNLNYNSRPAIWRTSFIQDSIGSLVDSPIMQGFEKLMMNIAEARAADGRGFQVGFLDKGVCHTFHQQTSERLHVGCEGKGIMVDVSSMKKRFDASLKGA